MAFKMKGFSGFKGKSPLKINTDGKKSKSKSNKSFDLAGYLRGEQGYIPDYKGKPTRQAANESTLLNPKSAKEVMADNVDSRERTRLMKQEAKRKKAGKKTSKSEAAYLKSYRDKSKKTRPNRKDRY